MKLNKQVMDECINDALGDNYSKKRVTVYSKSSATVLRYFDMTIPEFSIGGAASELIEYEIARTYPDVWKEVCKHVESNTYGQYVKSIDTAPIPIDATDSIWAQAAEEAEIKNHRTISVFNSRVSVTLRYLLKTIPRFSISTHASELLDKAIEKECTGVWVLLAETPALGENAAAFQTTA
jgi:hypothetical protein